ncbi:MAG: WGR domain-containing protein [Erythrobacter sp.]|jgi:predicted DNA-binding WGR domain protein|nr:WGR domain-containing protein [Erythrobacter sp.]
MRTFRCNEHWQAIDPARNIARDYQITATTDLFGWIIVERRWGRIGGKGRVTRASFADADAAERFVARIKARRASAPRRIGAAYRPV